ncbi:LOW QUALITY PROTEIN: poly(A)-specific ribonuclease PARN-like [Diadema antillarum]|uniref:LOW QUALITY PROTEIN: poly(A)-specific ribonuclease PARN-like n=1 Tax=Diadema antillarum TaxID=105358 RepID=UPI003A884A50
MEVTRENLNEALKLMAAALDHSSFVAIDGEFTGLHCDSVANLFDTPEERYQYLKNSCMDFLLIQLGICIFKFDRQKRGYAAHPFNFYVFPRPATRQAPDQRFLCQSSSIDFLVSHGFDFNKVFYKGIGYLSAVDRDRVKELIVQRHSQYEGNVSLLSDTSPNFSSPTVVKRPVEVPEEHKVFIDDVITQVQEFKASSEEELSLKPCSGFQRKLIYQSVRARFPTGLHLDTHTSEDKKDRFIIISRATEDDKKRLAQEKLQAELDEVDEASGMSRVLKLISESGKVVVGHNMMLDVLHIMHKFTGPLPDDLSEFKAMVGCVFSRLLDTKVMANTQPFKELFTMHALPDLLNKCQEEPFKKPNIVIPSHFPDYTASEKFHEAAYDAYVTGVCFATMANYLGTFLTPPKPRVSPTSNLIEPFLNKMFIHRIADIPYLNLAGPDLQPSRDHVFHVTFPPEWKAVDLYDLFSPFGSISISWIDDTSALVGLAKKERASTVLSSIEKNPIYQVTTYADFKKRQYMDGDFTPYPNFPDAAEPAEEVGPTEEVGPSAAGDSPRGKKRAHDHSPDKLDEFDPEVAGFMASSAKKTKQMDPNAAPFVSRRSVTPPSAGSSSSASSASAQPKMVRTSSEENDASAKGPAKLFEEPSTW